MLFPGGLGRLSAALTLVPTENMSHAALDYYYCRMISQDGGRLMRHILYRIATLELGLGTVTEFSSPRIFANQIAVFLII